MPLEHAPAMLAGMRTSISLLLVLAGFAVGCGDGGGGVADASSSGSDSGRLDSGTTQDSGAPIDAAIDGGRGADDAGLADAGGTDAGGTDAGGGTDSGGGSGDAGPSGCPCFGAVEIAAVNAHAITGGTRACMTGVPSGGTSVIGVLSSTRGGQQVRVDVAEISGVAGFDWFCGAGCSDLNDDRIDDCIGAPLGTYSMMEVTEVQHDACEALLATACGDVGDRR